MRIKGVEPIEVRLRNVTRDPMMAIVVYNLISDSGEVVSTKRIEVDISGYTRGLLDAILIEIGKTIESNDGINTNHELFEDLEGPKQKERKLKKTDNVLRSIPPGMMEAYGRLQDKESKGS